MFHLGKQGRYDAILLYHDQGHIACKTPDFERSITITFGLPFMRSSVDHGTAFDIATVPVQGGHRQYAGVDAGGRALLENEASIIADVNANQKDRDKSIC